MVAYQPLPMSNQAFQWTEGKTLADILAWAQDPENTRLYSVLPNGSAYLGQWLTEIPIGSWITNQEYYGEIVYPLQPSGAVYSDSDFQLMFKMVE